MSLDEIEIIDAVGTETESGIVVLSIIDSWDWTDEQYHLQALQGKLNTYFSFVESGQLYEAYSNADSHPVRIDIIGKFPIPQKGLDFLENASSIAVQLDINLTHRLH